MASTIEVPAQLATRKPPPVPKCGSVQNGHPLPGSKPGERFPENEAHRSGPLGQALAAHARPRHWRGPSPWLLVYTFKKVPEGREARLNGSRTP